MTVLWTADLTYNSNSAAPSLHRMLALNSYEQDSSPLTLLAKRITESSFSTVAADFECLVGDVLRDLSARKA